MTLKVKITCLLFTALPFFCLAQENSPYSRYGVGNILSPSNIANRAMGDISAGYSDAMSVNTINPATYSDLFYSTLDVGAEYDGRNLKSKDPLGTFKSKYGIMSYMQVGLPLLTGNKKAYRNRVSWGMALGLRPLSRINYKIQSTSNNIDTSSVIYEGNGGINEAFIGTGVSFRKISIGLNTGYLFGQKQYDSRLFFQNDTVDYKNAHYGNLSKFGGVFLTAGVQYHDSVGRGQLRIGLYGNLKRTYQATRDEVVETFNYDPQTEATATIDSVFQNNGQKGKVTLPATFGGGFTYTTEHLMIGMDYETTHWDDYRFFGQKDFVKNSWNTKIGIQYFPASLGSTGYFSFVKYRAGFSFGNDYIDIDHALPVYTISLGGAFPLKLRHSFYDLQRSTMNLAIEYGNRGNNQNNLTENIFRISLGFSLSDVWFRRQKYN